MIATVVYLFILALVLQPIVTIKATCQSTTEADMTILQKASNLSNSYRVYNDPVSGRDRILIGSISRLSVGEASEEEYSANKIKTEPINETEAETGKAVEPIPPLIKQDTCIFCISSSKQLREDINNTNCTKKIILLENGKYEGSFYIGNSSSNVTIQPRKDRASVIFDAKGGEFIFAIDNTSNISINGLTLKNGNNGILLDRVKNCIINGNKIYSFKFTGIFMNNTVINNSITNNLLSSDNDQNNVSGIILSESSDVIIENNEIRVGNENPNFNKNGNNYIDILLNNSFGNTIDFAGIGIITEDTILCGIICNEDEPMCACDSVEDDCQHFIGMSNNTWSFKC